VYHGEREIEEFSIKDLKHVRHGFDPEVHRPVALNSELLKHYGADVSFVGCWSTEKEARILCVLQRFPEISVKVYGIGWNRAGDEFKRRLGPNLKAGVFGDELSIVYCTSKINLGLLSASTTDSSLRDQTTARTFQIPATGSFMLHEDTDEVRQFFEDGKEVMLFSDNDELVEKVEIALKDPDLRDKICRQGYARCLSHPYDYSSAATTILKYFEERASVTDELTQS
jgi:spore maturation protein CgeB